MWSGIAGTRLRRRKGFCVEPLLAQEGPGKYKASRLEPDLAMLFVSGTGSGDQAIAWQELAPSTSIAFVALPDKQEVKAPASSPFCKLPPPKSLSTWQAPATAH